MTIDLHIVVSIVQLLVIGVGGLWFVWSMRTRLDLLIQETSIKHSANIDRFADIEKKLDNLANTAIEFVKQEARMNHIDDRLQELSNRISSHLKKRQTTR